MKEAVVDAYQADESMERQLVGYIVLDKALASDPNDVRAYLESKLPGVHDSYCPYDFGCSADDSQRQDGPLEVAFTRGIVPVISTPCQSRRARNLKS